MNILFKNKEVLAGILLSVIVILIIKLFPFDKQPVLWAITMTIILSIYIGFAIKDGDSLLLIIQMFGAAFFLSLTLCGLWISPWLLVSAFILHGLWDLIHEGKILKKLGIPWYADFCIVVDWLLGAWLILEITVFDFGSFI